MFSNTRVYIKGCFPQHSLTEFDLFTWAEELWGQVSTVKIGYNQVIIDFDNIEAAGCCSILGHSYYGNVPVQIFSSEMRLLNGVLVRALAPKTRSSDYFRFLASLERLLTRKDLSPCP